MKRFFFVLLISLSLLATSSVYAVGPGDGPPPPNETNGIPPPVGAPLPIDNDISFLFVAGILLASYVLYKKPIPSTFNKN